MQPERCVLHVAGLRARCTMGRRPRASVLPVKPWASRVCCDAGWGGVVVNIDLWQRFHLSPLHPPVLLQLQNESRGQREAVPWTENSMFHQQHSCSLNSEREPVGTLQEQLVL